MIDLSSSSRNTAVVRVLIVEDERLIARDIKEIAESFGYEVLGISISGEEAIAQARRLRPSLVLMDIGLEGELDGIAAAQTIWSELRIPVVYSTVYSDAETLDRVKATAPFGYLIKPFREQDLMVAIETALNRYELEKQLHQHEQWLTIVLQSMGDAVIVFDTQHRVRFFNPAAEALTGWARQDAYDRSVEEVFPLIYESTREPVENPVTIALRKSAVVHLVDGVLLIDKAGNERPVADSVAPLVNESGTVTGAVAIFRDITVFKQAQKRQRAIEQAQQLERRNAELERLNRLKDDFVSTVSHELRSPLTNIKMAVEMLEIAMDKQGFLAQEPQAQNSAAHYLKILRSQCSQEIDLINDLLDLQRLNTEGYQLDLQPLDLPSWLSQILAAFEGRVRQRERLFQVNVPAQLPTLISDHSALRRIIAELLSNACKYTPEGETIEITVALHQAAATTDMPAEAPATEADPVELSGSTQPSRILCVRLRNTGIEIPSDELPCVFDAFYRVLGADRWKHGGTGLGLALTKRLTHCLGGSIQVESQANQTCFEVRLPVTLQE